jgi:tetratricopeptide (TPR) repeat protein
MTAVLWIALAIAPQDPAAAAEEAWRRGDFAGAHAIYAQLAASPAGTDATTLYNLGNCAFRLGRYAEAVLAYRRALLRRPGDERILFNLRLAESRLGLRGDADPAFLPAALAGIDALPPPLALFLVLALGTAGLIGLVAAGSRRAGLRALFVILLAAGSLLGARLAWNALGEPPPDAVVLTPRLPLRPDPHASLTPSLELRAGETVRVLESSERWARVSHSRGSGWTDRAALGLVD